MKKLFVMILLMAYPILSQASLTKSVTLDDGRAILAADNGLSLYTFDPDDENQSNCFGRCLRTWPALTTELDSLEEPFAIHIRDDGTKQVTLNGQPLYFFVGDQAEGDINGDRLGGTWHLVDAINL